MSGNTTGKIIALAVGIVLPVVIFLYLILGPGRSDPGEAPAGTSSPVAPAALSLAFLTGDDQVVHIVAVSQGDTLHSLPSGQGGFLRGILRPLERERARNGVELGEPYTLVRESSGELLLQDPGSDLTVDVAAFGSTSAALFNALISGGPLPEVPSLLNTPSSSMEDRP